MQSQNDVISYEKVLAALTDHINHNSMDMLLDNKGVTYGDLLELLVLLKQENDSLKEQLMTSIKLSKIKER